MFSKVRKVAVCRLIAYTSIYVLCDFESSIQILKTFFKIYKFPNTKGKILTNICINLLRKKLLPYRTADMFYISISFPFLSRGVNLL